MQETCELLAFVIHRPSTCAREWDRTGRLFAGLETRLPLKVITAAQMQSQTEKLETVVGKILVDG